MQTFLPYSSFQASAEALDYRRLGKQRIETLQILQTLNGDSNGWRNHPAVKMWEGFIPVLAIYGIVICQEWKNRGYKDTTLEKIKPYLTTLDCCRPPWLGDEAFHASHRSNLLRKDFAFYSKYGWTEGTELPYMWPTKNS